jgi:hypothetical protein
VSRERGVSLRHSKLLYQQTGVLLPVGSREFLPILLSLKKWMFFLLEKRKKVQSLKESITKVISIKKSQISLFQFLRNMQAM